MATYVNDLRLKEIATGDESGTWGTSTNTNLELIAEAFSFGTEAITTNADTHTTTIADGSTDPGRSLYLKYTGTLDSACTITIGPNTVSKLWFIENGTSGSQNIIISQGSGANITIPPGDVKAVYSDGAGSGAAVVDAFASLNVVDLKVQDDLTVTDDATVGGTLGVTGILTCTDDIIIGDGKTIGSASDVDAMTIASNGQVTFSQTLIGTALDISGDIDVDGTTNLDVVDIDGAVDMASTLQVDGAITSSSAATITTADNNPQMTLVSTDADANVGPVLKLYRNSSSPADNDLLGRIQFTGEDDAGNENTFARVNVIATDVSNGSEDARMEFAPAVADDFTPTMSLTSGNVGIGTTSPASLLSLQGDAEILRLDGTANTTRTIFFRNTTAANPAQIHSDGSLKLRAEDSGTHMEFHTVDTERMRITSAGRFLIGNTAAITPASGIVPFSQVIGTTASTSSFSLNRFSADANASSLFFVKSRNGTPGSNTIVQSGDTIGVIDFKMDDGTNYQSQVARIMAKIDGTPGENDAPGRLTFHTTADGAATVSERMRIDSSGDVGIGTTSPSGTLHVKDSAGADLYLEAGTTSENSVISFGDPGDNNIGMIGYAHSDNSMRFTTNTSEAMRIDSSGNVGIGTTSPSFALHVDASGSGVIAGFFNDTDTTSEEALLQVGGTLTDNYGVMFGAKPEADTPAVQDHAFIVKTNDSTGTDHTERFRISSDGKCGIGTASPQKALDIAGASSSGGAVMRLSGTGEASQGDVTGAIQFHSADTTDNTPGVFGMLRGIAGASGGEGSLQILTDMPSEGADASNITMHFNSNGNVGVGTSSPSTLLELSADGTCNFRMSDSSSPSTFAQFVSANGVLQLKADQGDAQGASSMQFHVDTSEKMRIDSSGNLLLGTTSTLGGSTDDFMTVATVNGGRGGIRIGNTSGSSNTTCIRFHNSNGAVGAIRTSGSATAYDTSSDARLKDVTGSARGLDVINNLNPVAYNWKADGKADEGLIAQEVEELVPNAVNQNEDGYYQMDYSKLVTHLIKGMQEQQEQIESLKSEIANLKEN